MSNFSEDKIQTIWNSAKTIDGVDKSEWRKDACDAWINRNQYGQETSYGWEIDHILPESKGGTDHTSNLRPMQWQNNRSKGDDFPDYNAAVTSDGNKNIEKQEGKTIHKDTLSRIQQLYPTVRL